MWPMKNARPVGDETLVVVAALGVNGWARKDRDGWTHIRVIGPGAADGDMVLKPGTRGVFEVINDGLFGVRKEFC